MIYKWLLLHCFFNFKYLISYLYTQSKSQMTIKTLLNIVQSHLSLMKRLIIIDASNFIFRAFYAIRPLTSPDGTPVNALYGTTSMILKIIQNYKPTHLIVANDSPTPTFRKQKFPQYKANRSTPHDDLKVQFPLVNKMIDLMEIKRLKMDGYEADDLIATVVVKYQEHFDEVLIASGDKDLMQLVNQKVKVLDTQRDVIYNEEKVFEKFGVKTSQIQDYLSILGDKSDNVPGVKGIGAKGAAKLLTDYESLEGIYQNLESIKSDRTKQCVVPQLDLLLRAVSTSDYRTFAKW